MCHSYENAVRTAVRKTLRDTPAEYTEYNYKLFRDSIDSLNEFSKPSVLLRYQANILDGGGFDVISPLSGSPIRIDRSVSVAGHTAYWMPDCAAWLIAGYVGLGYPIHSLTITGENSSRYPLIRDAKPKRVSQFREFRGLKTLRLDETEPPTEKRAILRIGHENFAHHLRNELSALEEWLHTATPEQLARISISASDEPIGPLGDVFPQLAGCEIVSDISDDASGVTADNPISVRVGSRLVTERLRQRVRDYAERHAQAVATHPARHLLATAWPRIWISTRTGWRTAANFDALFLALVPRVFRAYPRAAMFMDGFSFPLGFFDDPRTADRRDSFVSRATETEVVITELKSKVKEQFGTELADRICSISGIDLMSAIALGAACDYYICHFGTLQHKIGWIHDIPGMMHGPSSSRTDGFSLRWHRTQVEGGVAPDAIPSRLIVVPGDTNRRKSWNRDYEFSDVEEAASIIVYTMQNRLPNPPEHIA